MAIRRHGKRWQVRLSVGGRRTETTLPRGATKADAQALEARLRREAIDLAVGRRPQRLIDEALLAWIDGEARLLKSRRILLYRIGKLQPLTAGKFLADLPTIAAAVARWPLSAAGRNRYLCILKRIGRLAAQWGWIDADPAARVRLLPGEKARHTYLQPADVRLLAQEAGRSADAIVLLALTGLRRGELFAAELAGDALRVADSKSGAPRMVPLSPEAAPIARRAIPLAISPRQLRADFERARAAIGRPDLRLHDLRHTFASWLIQAGAGLPVLRDLLGHQQIATTMRYAHLEEAAKRAAIIKLPRVGQRVDKRRKS